MSGALHLCGGGWAASPPVWRGFLEDAAARSAGKPRIGVLAVRDGDQTEHAATLGAVLEAAGPVEVIGIPVRAGGVLDAERLDRGFDGLLVGGGRMPAYLDAIEPHRDLVRRLVASGTPYAGFSAGAAIAARRAIMGGSRIDGRAVLGEEGGPGTSEVTVRDGLGLVDHAIDVHAAQWGTLTRLIAATEAGLVGGGAAIDEGTAVVVRSGRTRVVGDGAVWWTRPGPDGVLVQREAAGSPDP